MTARKSWQRSPLTSRQSMHTSATELLRSLIQDRAREIDPVSEWWVGGPDEVTPYCGECIEAAVEAARKEDPDDEEIEARGGYGSQSGDSQGFCTTCGCWLWTSPTLYMVEQKLSLFEEYGCDIEYPSECYSMVLVIENIEPEHETRLEELCQIILQVILHG